MTIIEYTLEYTLFQKWNKKNISKINQIRLFKQAILLCELVRMNGREIIECFYDINIKSCLVWKLPQLTVPKPRGNYIIGRWKSFL